jgi:hypothetical protein
VLDQKREVLAAVTSLLLTALLLGPQVVYSGVQLASVQSPAGVGETPTRGYVGRACGFDFDFDGVVGEASDCTLGDASSGTGIQTTTIGSTTWEEIYVDCDAGSNVGTCGGPEDACLTVSYAFNTRADGPGDGNPDSVWFKGTCSAEDEAFTPDHGGVSGTWTKTASGSEQWDFQFPTKPAIIAGWDADGDDSYPPFDADDTAIWEGDVDGVHTDDDGMCRTFEFGDGAVDNSYFELAHFTVQNFGHNTEVQCQDTLGVGAGVMTWNTSGSNRSHMWMHDMVLDNINADRQPFSQRATWTWFGIQQSTYIAMVNINLTDNGSYINRGAGCDTSCSTFAQYLRWQNLSLTAHGCDEGTCPGGGSGDSWVSVMKIWGFVNNFEWLDSVLDANLANWSPNSSSGTATSGPGLPQCARDLVVRNVEFIDFKAMSSINSDDPSNCVNERHVDDFLLDRNKFVTTSTYYGPPNPIISIDCDGPDADSSCGDVTITNNYIYSAEGNRCIDMDVSIAAGTIPAGTVTIENNTLVCEGSGSATIDLLESETFDRRETFVINGNVVSGPSLLMDFAAYNPASLTADYNVYESGGGSDFACGGGNLTFTNWKSTCSVDTNSSDCTVTFEDEANQDFHLASGDTCAQDLGPTSPYASVDWDGDSRCQNTDCDAGADEVAP